jgi:hypothetical protein
MEREISKVICQNIPEKLSYVKGHSLMLSSDNRGSLFLHDFRDRVGSIKLTQNIGASITCLLTIDSEVLLFSSDLKCRALDVRTGQTSIRGDLAEEVFCATTTESISQIILASNDIRLVSRDTLEVKQTYRISKGRINSMLREKNMLVCGGFDCEMKVSLSGFQHCGRQIVIGRF